MVYKIDNRYITVVALKALGAYILGILIVAVFLSLKTPLLDFACTAFVALLPIFFIYHMPKKIRVEDGEISFVKKNSTDRIKINPGEITHLEQSRNLYNTLIITTKSGTQYELHPQDLESLTNAIEAYKHK